MHERAPRPRGLALAFVCALSACGAELALAPDDGAADAGVADGGGASRAPSDAGSNDAGDASASIPPAGGADGICVPGDVTLGFYDPDCVYLKGTTVPASIGYDVLVDPANPQRVAKGFDRQPLSFHLRPSDRRLLFRTSVAAGTDVIKSFRPGGTHEIVAATCDEYGPRDVFPSPDSPALLYSCIWGGTKYFFVDEPQPVDFGGKYVVGLGANGSVLVRELGGGFFIRDAAGEHPVVGAGESFGHARAKPGGGFLIEAVTLDDVHFPNLYDVSASGEAKLIGKYWMGVYALTAHAVLEPDGALVGIVTLEQPSTDGIVRFRVGSPPEIVFDESTSPIQIHGGELVTGP
jgi:hypothetical protein